ncbi:histone H3 K4-specific methyltransferase SET7/9 N-terminal domain-containing protein [Aspergillus affinis]|uniref:histone H3 K4-specific methyltransferase SET7/9 N-terminal domain-containing protein n=1 Tax=Aspergillus affinis TaxID=1070780 RepID=UPI0022FE9B7B|nr:histone H3 K4-specific methyltransferase SET7/9 N-terminal domain-containing protein [Aspergillus affinis]KAI9034978.1 histone H3 K4-specific methyltransferase SET7/9 N-terminal domain-containing protein [Aspergillus affinis]
MGTYVTDLPWTTSGKPGKYTGAVIVKPNGSRVPDGQGIILYNVGKAYYEGQWKNGQQWFQGQYSFPNYVYNGEWRHDAPNGQGELRSKDKGTHIGNFVNWKRDGAGVHTLADGKTTNGIYRNNKLHERFTKRWPNGDYYTGTWNATTQTGHGQGRISWSTGRIYERDLKDDCIPHGRGKKTYANGTVRHRTWNNGSFQG